MKTNNEEIACRLVGLKRDCWRSLTIQMLGPIVDWLIIITETNVSQFPIRSWNWYFFHLVTNHGWMEAWRVGYSTKRAPVFSHLLFVYCYSTAYPHKSQAWKNAWKEQQLSKVSRWYTNYNLNFNDRIRINLTIFVVAAYSYSWCYSLVVSELKK